MILRKFYEKRRLRKIRAPHPICGKFLKIIERLSNLEENGIMSYGMQNSIIKRFKKPFTTVQTYTVNTNEPIAPGDFAPFLQIKTFVSFD